ncbi:MAG: AbrB/MazE/SpoVT family DNA-binding domain-containing protein [Candidatus Aenigmarchaeota archaeon]|nr:AbrB/MazE/SpoVT family DNA-binding domain-containing protein [Candidatus Aenigmarchaeota archaeon]
MRRKVIKQGHNTLTITLPSSWVNKFNIKTGDELDVREQGKILSIGTEKSSGTSSVTIDISNLTPPIIWRYILSVYRAGYDEIRVIGFGKSKKNISSSFSPKTNLDYLLNNKITMTSPTDAIIFSTSSSMRTGYDFDWNMNPVETITACVNRLINVEIIEQKENYCVIKELGETTYKEFDNAIRRIFILLNFEAEYIMAAIKGNKNEVKHIHIVDTNLDRFEDFCLRVLNKRGFSDFNKTPVMFTVVFLLEMMGDELKKIGLHLLENKKINTKFMIELFDVQMKQINRFYKLFYNFNKEHVLEIYDEDKKGSELIAKYYKRLNNDEKELLHHFKKIGTFVLNLTELKIDMES